MLSDFINIDVINIIGEYVFDSDIMYSKCLWVDPCSDREYDIDHIICISGPCKQSKNKIETCSECKLPAKVFNYDIIDFSYGIIYQMCYEHAFYNIDSGVCEKCDKLLCGSLYDHSDWKCSKCRVNYCKDCIHKRYWWDVVGCDEYNDIYANGKTEPLCDDCWKIDVRHR